MFIEVSKVIKDTELEQFIQSYDLVDLHLKNVIKTNKTDSLKKLGWHIETNDHSVLVISKPLFSFDLMHNAADKIILAEKHPSSSDIFPNPNTGVKLGFNKFKSKKPFITRDTEVTFISRNNLAARSVYLVGSFNNWAPDKIPMRKTDSSWVATIKLTPGKHWYKFIVDGTWVTDGDNELRENDGRGNTNSVYYKTNVYFKLNGFTNARRVFLAGSFNNWNNRHLEMKRTAGGWNMDLYLAEGTHPYKFVVDGDWHVDPHNSQKLPDGVGAYNSVVKIGKPHLFKLNGYLNAKKVLVAGTFNDWRDFELEMYKTATGWELPYVIGGGNYEYKFIVDDKWISDPSNSMTIKNGNSYLIVNPNYTFKLKGYENARRVYLSGDFNNWNPQAYPMVKEGNEWVFRLNLAPGKQRYKYVIDGKWILDPSNKLWEQNEYGTGNSLIWIEK